ncbi:FecR family protein [Chitinophaga caseinilytica]|uniref:FecR domain-containing protein n=1 Tax=Chitinophaga caseinilytica TaxID=2267521 RepID=A0ABZ2YXB8_9BACT
MDTAQVKVLAAKYLDGTATPEEAAALHDWYDQVNAGDTEIVTTEQQTSLEDTRARMLARMQEQMRPAAPLRPLRRKWLPAAAAAALLLLATGAYLLRQQGKPAGQPAAKLTPATPPGNSKGVTLTLGNGQVVELDSSADGYLAQQGGSTVSKEESLLVYGPEKPGEAPVINKLNVPKGEQYRLILPDGTKVWLNAASELQFPSAFAGEQRLVELNGEGYFEVAANAAQPFVVQTPGPRIEVLGTHFNVKAYPGEPGIQTALLEGSVRVVAGNGKSKVMRPGEVATVGEGADISVLQDADAAQNVAWKDGLFVFRNADLSVILREIGRWYDVDIVYEGPVSPRRFTGKVSREYSLSETLSVLLASNLHFRQEGKKIIVLP